MKYKILAFVMILSINLSIGQDNDLKIEDVRVIKDFDVQIADFNKINIDPVLPVFDIKSRIYEYKVRALPVKLDYEKPKIRPLALKPEILDKPKNYFFKLGYGIPKILDIDASAGFIKNDMEVFLRGGYIGADNSNNLSNQKYFDASFDFSVKKNDLIRDMKYGLAGSFTNTYNYLYSNIPINTDSSENLRRRYLLMNIESFFEKSNLRKTLNNRLEIGMNVLQFNAGNFNETELEINDKFDYNLNNNSSVIAKADLCYIFGSKDYVLKARPYYQYNSKRINAKLGGSIGTSQEKYLLSPYLELSSNLFHNFIEIYIGYNSDFFNNTGIYKLNINPFLNFEDENLRTYKSNNIVAGVRNSLEGALIEISATYSIFEDHHFFRINPEDSMTFNSVFDNGKNIKLEAKVSYKPIGNFEIGGSVRKNFYELENLAHAYYIPDFEINAYTKIKFFKNKLIVGGELYTGTAPWYLDIQGNSKKLDPLFDLNTNADFKLSKNISAFAEINNIFAQKYKKWYGYENFGINLIGGLKVVF